MNLYIVTSVCMTGSFVTIGTGDVPDLVDDGYAVATDGISGVAPADLDEVMSIEHWCRKVEVEEYSSSSWKSKGKFIEIKLG